MIDAGTLYLPGETTIPIGSRLLLNDETMLSNRDVERIAELPGVSVWRDDHPLYARIRIIVEPRIPSITSLPEPAHVPLLVEVDDAAWRDIVGLIVPPQFRTK